MLGAVGWIVVAWVLLSLPLGICVGAVLRRSAVGLAAVIATKSLRTPGPAHGVGPASPRTAQVVQSLRGSVRPDSERRYFLTPRSASPESGRVRP